MMTKVDSIITDKALALKMLAPRESLLPAMQSFTFAKYACNKPRIGETIVFINDHDFLTRLPNIKLIIEK